MKKVTVPAKWVPCLKCSKQHLVDARITGASYCGPCDRAAKESK